MQNGSLFRPAVKVSQGKTGIEPKIYKESIVMKKSFLSAAILTVFMAAILFGGCDAQSADDGDGGGGNFSGTMTDQPVSAAGDPLPTEGPYTLKMWALIDDHFRAYADDVGTFADGELSFTLPDTIKTKDLSAFFDDFSEDLTVNPPNSKVLLVMGFAVYDGDENLIGRLYYAVERTTMMFLYSSGAFTVNSIDSSKGPNCEIAAETGWNTVLFGRNDSMTSGSPPTGAEWRFSNSF
jgi:hypothetical protein